MSKIKPLLAILVLLSSCNFPSQTSSDNLSDREYISPINSPAPSIDPRARQDGPISVDSCGADPWDVLPDSDAIQKCINKANSGDTILFTSGINQSGYQGYLIDKTIYLVMYQAKNNLTFTASDPDDKPLLIAADDLKGFVINIVARSTVPDYGRVDDIRVSHLQIDGNRQNRICMGPDELGDGNGDHWGSWLWQECPYGFCDPGTFSMCGASDLNDIDQDYLGNPDGWSTGLIVDDVHVSNTECASALPLCGAASVIKNSLIDTAGDKVLAAHCKSTDPDEPHGDWADGITYEGPDNTIINTTVIDASDVGIVFFGGKNTVIANNTVVASEGNHGMFAGIAIHPWGWGDVSGTVITGNIVRNDASQSCGGIHAGINLGTHMWNGGCFGFADRVSVGNPNHCSAEPLPPGGNLCTAGEPCQLWAYVSAGKTLTLTNNEVSGAQINYLVEGLDLEGEFIDSGNISNEPRYTDWVTDAGCGMGGVNDRWGVHDYVAHHPTLPGWTDKRVHCEY